MAKKCRHRNGIVLAHASYVEFTPDQEPFKEGVIEHCGIKTITAINITIYWCPKCQRAQSIEVDDIDWIEET